MIDKFFGMEKGVMDKLVKIGSRKNSVRVVSGCFFLGNLGKGFF